MKNKYFSTIVLIAIVFLSFGQVRAQKTEIKQFTLKNGLTVILNEDHSKTEVFGLVIVKAGAKNDPKDATGMAHYQEHMLFKGTTELGTSNWDQEKKHIDTIIKLYDELGKTTNDSLRADIQKEINKESIEAGKYTILNETSTLINKMGGTNLNAGTGMDQTVYYNSFPPNQIERWIELYSHRFSNPVFRAFQSELETVYEEKNMYMDNFFTSLLESFNKNFYKNHPYGQQTVIGETEHLKNPSLSKMYEFFNTYYVANNMAVVLVGDFNIEEVSPLIEKHFGMWKSGKLPEKPIYKENPFNGREEFVGHFSPIRIGILGFRSVPLGHADELPLQVFNNMLSNEKGTGALNKLAQNGELMEAQAISFHQVDHGADIVFFIPKLIGQKMSKAENMVINTIREVRDGDIDKEALEQTKKEMYMNFLLSMEDFEMRGNQIANGFVQGKDPKELFSTPQKINDISIEDVKRVAKKYYGDNYLAFYSKMGAPKKEKLEKPNYDAVSTDHKAISTFAKHFDKIPEKETKIKFVDFEKDIARINMGKGLNINVVNNELNDIYTISIIYKVGNLKIKEAGYTADLMNYAGTNKMSRDEFQTAMAQTGASYSFSADGETLVVKLSGIESSMKDALSLLGHLIENPVITKQDLKTAKNNNKANQKFENESPADVSQALLSYTLYGDKSRFIHRMSKKDIKKYSIDSFNNIWNNLTKYECEVHAATQLDIKQFSEILTSNVNFCKEPFAEDKEVHTTPKTFDKNIVYFVNRNDALQSNIYFFANSNKFDKEIVPVKEAFNTYFGGGFSGIILQEIREYRSLAYTAYANMSSPDYANENNYFIGMIGTQADKTMEAIKVFHDLKNEMPKMPERMEYIKPYLGQKAITAYPNFRRVSQYVEHWKDLGYKEDPSRRISKSATEIKFEEIYKYYNDNLRKQPMVTMIVGDESKIDMTALTKYGEVVVIDENDLYTK